MKRASLAFGVVLMVVFAFGCAITDYDGIPGHKTTGEAKFWGLGVAFTGFGANLDGTYDYTAKYDNGGVGSGNVTITSYRIPGIVSFNRDGLVDRDGDDVQGNSGDAGGKWSQWVRAIDGAKGTCEFDANFPPSEARMWADGDIGVALCLGGVEEEIDSDWDLNRAFSSLDSLLKQIWDGTLSGDFTLEVTALRINGVSHSLAAPLSIGASVGVNTPGRFSIANGPEAGAAIRTILENTGHLEPVQLGLEFDGGLQLDALPGGDLVAFNHDALWAFAQ